jgi:hypothetical protein
MQDRIDLHGFVVTYFWVYWRSVGFKETFVFKTGCGILAAAEVNGTENV